MNATVATALATDLATLATELDVRADAAPLGYGRDLWCVTDLTATMDTIAPDSRLAIAQAVVRRWITPRGALLDDPDYGYDVRGKLNRGLTQVELRSLGSLMRLEARKDDRVSDAAVTVSFDGETLHAATVLTCESITLGTFTLTLALDAIGVTQLELS